MVLGWAPALALLLTTSLSALGSIFILAAVQRREHEMDGRIFAEADGGTRYLFDGDTLLDATPSARALLAHGVGGTAWSALLSIMARSFPDIEARLSNLETLGTLTLVSDDPAQPSVTLTAELRGGLTRIELSRLSGKGDGSTVDLLTLHAQQQEARVLRDAVNFAPVLIWREAADGRVIWANRPYLLAAAERLEPGSDLAWPLPALFGESTATPEAPGRHRLCDAQGAPLWFDVTRAANPDGQLGFATAADALVISEATRRDYTRTLSKTFAHLPIGLAIFDRQNLLVNFNPALVDLCRLPTELLLSRPTLFSVLDAMRDRNMIPEPKDYRQWQQVLSGTERAASTAPYEEIWTLPSGETYRLTGRSYAEGGLALMFEDISSETSRARRYRAEIELGQAVIDALDDSIAVFAATGDLIMTNRRYADLMGDHPTDRLEPATFAAQRDAWALPGQDTGFWDAAEQFVHLPDEAPLLSHEVVLANGTQMRCSLSRLPGRMTLVRFCGPAGDPLQEQAVLRRA